MWVGLAHVYSLGQIILELSSNYGSKGGGRTWQADIPLNGPAFSCTV